MQMERVHAIYVAQIGVGEDIVNRVVTAGEVKHHSAPDCVRLVIYFRFRYDK